MTSPEEDRPRQDVPVFQFDLEPEEIPPVPPEPPKDVHLPDPAEDEPASEGQETPEADQEEPQAMDAALDVQAGDQDLEYTETADPECSPPVTDSVVPAEEDPAPEIDQSESPALPPEEARDPEQTAPETPDEENIEARITAFEEDLSYQCPMCKVSRIQACTTGTGKTYYRCSSDTCNFISWGRPHHIPCPRCGNLFLIESLDRNGEILLKCPRATCRHWQRLNEPPEQADISPSPPTTGTVRPKKRKVVKRKKRAVRRKR
jgi:ssDNA-binding Zn-finger/Zn-ribbon topoisomerase 1